MSRQPRTDEEKREAETLRISEKRQAQRVLRAAKDAGEDIGGWAHGQILACEVRSLIQNIPQLLAAAVDLDQLAARFCILLADLTVQTTALAARVEPSEFQEQFKRIDGHIQAILDELGYPHPADLPDGFAGPRFSARSGAAAVWTAHARFHFAPQSRDNVEVHRYLAALALAARECANTKAGKIPRQHGPKERLFDGILGAWSVIFSVSLYPYISGNSRDRDAGSLEIVWFNCVRKMLVRALRRHNDPPGALIRFFEWAEGLQPSVVNKLYGDAWKRLNGKSGAFFKF